MPTWPIDRFRLEARRAGEPDHAATPFALLAPESGGPKLYALAPEAAAAKLRCGLGLADARAICPGLVVADAAPARDAEALQALALWCGRYSPWVAVDGDDGVLLDITGCAHLLGGEASLLADLETRLRPLGFRVRAAAASNPAAAWAWARFGRGGVLASARGERAVLELPVAALGLDAATVAGLERLGFKRVRDLEAVPHAPLATRFGTAPVERLHRLMGRMSVPFTPLAPPARHAVRLAWAEPLGTHEGVEAALGEALTRLAGELARAQEGARHLRLDLARLDGAVHRLEARTARASRDAGALARLFGDDLDGLDLGFGVECLRLAAVATERLTARQLEAGGGEDDGDGDGAGVAAARLIDRLSGRLGPERVRRLVPCDSHLPERASRLVPAREAAVDGGPWPERGPRPLRLLAEPRPVGAVAAVPDGAPRRLRLDGGLQAVIAAEGPERIAPEWWREPDAATRDYHRLDLADGRRLWVRRSGGRGDGRGDGAGAAPRWTLAGVFA